MTKERKLTQQDRAEPERHRGSPLYERAEDNAPKYAAVPTWWKNKVWKIVHPTVEHVHGPEEVSYGMDELIVLCLVRDGRPYVRSFVEHYSSMGVKHLVFLDNGSTDGTVEALKNYDNVTVLRTGLSFKQYQGLMKQYLVERFGRGRWSLYVDIDELFDYPYSDVVSLGSLLGYLNSNSYTAVVAQMLDMFPEEPLSGRADNLDEPLKERHRFYDLSNLRRLSITEHKRCPPDNTYANNDIAAFSGGIRWTVFGVRTFLTKHPLVFLDDKLKPLAGAHWARHARVADFTCVLYHYKFLDEHLRRQATQAVHERKKRKNKKGAHRYKKYSEILEKTPYLSIKTGASRELESVNDLIGTQLVSVSRQYMRFVESEQRNGDYPEESRSERLLEAFFNARGEVTALAEQVQAMRRRQAKHERSTARLQSRLKESKRRLEETERSVTQLRERLAEAERAEQDLVLLLRRLANGPLGWFFGLKQDFRILKHRYLGADD
jgi:Glycosyl transferase family 2